MPADVIFTLLPEEKPSRWPPIKLCLVSFLVAMGGSFHFGFQLLITNPSQDAFIRFLNASNVHQGNRKPWSTLESEWSFIVATFFLGCTHGAFLIRYFMRQFTRKSGMIVSMFIQLAACAAAVASYYLLYSKLFFASRYFFGLGITLTVGLSAIFITEISPINYRGITSLANGIVLQCALVVGAIVAMPEILGTETLWPLMYILEAAILLVVILLMPLIPDSPEFLIAQKSRTLAVEAVQFYHDVSQENAEIHVKEMEEKDSDKDVVGLFSVLLDGFTRRGALMGIVVMWGMAMTGITVINAFSFEILLNAGLAPFHASIANAAICVFSVIGIFASTIIIEKHGRRPLLLWTFGILVLLNIAISVLLAAHDFTQHWIVAASLVAAICIFNFVFAMGPGPLSLFISGELVHQNARAACATWANAIMAIQRFALLAIYVPLRNHTSEAATYGMLFIPPMIFLVWVVYHYLPETKGRSAQELENEYNEQYMW